jgi:hypothetical protein
LAGLVAVAGCDDGPSSNDLPSGQRQGPAQDADADLVDRVTSQIDTALGAVLAGRSSNRQLRVTLRPLERLHTAHLSALDAADVAATAGAPLGIAGVRSAETRLQRQLTDACIRAESGALAGLLASMAAAVAQHVAVLP